MLHVARTKSDAGSVIRLSGLIFHATVRELRKDHGNALAGLVLNVAQTLVFLCAFYLLVTQFGLRAASVRGDFMLYIMSGIFLFMTHTKAMGAVVASEGPASPMMKHAPMTTLVAIGAAALGALYVQTLSMALLLGVYHLAWTPVVIDRPAGALAMFLLAWLSGVGVGLVFLAAKPWAPRLVGLGANIYSRANIFASGKMFVANMMPAAVLAVFAWNPLFHTIDQARGFAFVNYTPHHSNVAYPFCLTVALVFLGLLGEYHTRRRISISRQAGR